MQENQLKEKIDQKKEKIFREVIDLYVNSKVKVEGDNAETKEIVKGSIESAITEFIIEKEVDRIANESKDKIAENEHKNKVRQVKVIIIETLILGCLVGLLVNQLTDIISILKGGNIDIGKTVMWIIIILIFNLVFGLFMYINKLDEIINKK